jgi:oxygen-independent coproporphyrinogen-3 oxidase
MAGLYIHVPFCQRKCAYCDFYSIEGIADTDSYLHALNSETAAAADEYAARESIQTLFIGGGTPSLLQIDELQRMLTMIRQTFTLAPDAEITIEVNPGTVNRDKIENYLTLGINRISIGVQSFHDDELTFLQRIHSSAEAVRCIEDAKAAGCNNISVDLIFSLPGQKPERWRETLERAFSLGPQHISTYSLIIEDQTPLARMIAAGLVTPIPDDDDAFMYELTLAAMHEAGYQQYEISNFSLPGFSCKHNVNYWNHSNYLALGPSSHSFWKTDDAHARRWWNVRSLSEYCRRLDQRQSPVDGFEELGTSELLREAIFLSLRCGSLDTDALRKRFGSELTQPLATQLQEYENKNLVVRDGTLFRLTSAGYMVCDGIAASLL